MGTLSEDCAGDIQGWPSLHTRPKEHGPSQKPSDGIDGFVP